MSKKVDETSLSIDLSQVWGRDNFCRVLQKTVSAGNRKTLMPSFGTEDALDAASNLNATDKNGYTLRCKHAQLDLEIAGVTEKLVTYSSLLAILLAIINSEVNENTNGAVWTLSETTLADIYILLNLHLEKLAAKETTEIENCSGILFREPHDTVMEHAGLCKDLQQDFGDTFGNFGLSVLLMYAIIIGVQFVPTIPGKIVVSLLNSLSLQKKEKLKEEMHSILEKMHQIDCTPAPLPTPEELQRRRIMFGM